MGYVEHDVHEEDSGHQHSCAEPEHQHLQLFALAFFRPLNRRLVVLCGRGRFAHVSSPSIFGMPPGAYEANSVRQAYFILSDDNGYSHLKCRAGGGGEYTLPVRRTDSSLVASSLVEDLCLLHALGWSQVGQVTVRVER